MTRTTRPRIIPRNDAFRRAWLAGIPKAKIAAALGVNEGSITYVAKQMGLPMRKLCRKKSEVQ